MIYVRITAEPTADNRDAFPISVDAKIDGNSRITSATVLFGVDGLLGENAERYPFTLNQHGRLDYGSECADADRDAQFDLRDGAIVLDRALTLTGSFGTKRYRISQITPL
jgi:hypothetical protein